MSLDTITKILKSCQHLVVLTGAGISAESGLPTFRGKEGYWKKGSKNYHPMELATYQAFQEDPLTVWEWYQYRRSMYTKASPNPGHYAIVELEQWFLQNTKKISSCYAKR